MAHRLHGAKKAGLLFELSQGCLLDGLTSIDEASWELDARPTRARSELGHKNDLLGSLFPTNYGDNPDLSTHFVSATTISRVTRACSPHQSLPRELCVPPTPRASHGLWHRTRRFAQAEAIGSLGWADNWLR